MVQRIQTLFFTLAAGVLFGQFGVPYLQTNAGNPAATLEPLTDGVLNPMDNYGILGLTLLGGFIALGSVFLFKNRPLQAKLAGGGILVSVFLMVLAGFVSKVTLDAIPEGGHAELGAGLAAPVIALVNFWLALRNIRKDEALVRSMDRLR
jgi:hypothetical protein